jgi:hypothetical protein
MFKRLGQCWQGFLREKNIVIFSRENISKRQFQDTPMIKKLTSL